MKEKLFFVCLILTIMLVSVVYAKNQIPLIVLGQKIVDWDSYQSQNDTRIMINPANNYIKLPSVMTKLIDWRLSSKEEAQSIAESFIKNSEDKLNVLFNDLKLQEVILSADQNFDYNNPSATVSYKQYYHEIPVFDARLSVGINAYGTIWSVGNQLITNITAPTAPIITSGDSIKVAKERYIQTELNLEKAPELFIYKNKLVWRLYILQPIFKEIMIDSQNSEVVLERGNLREENSVDAGVQKNGTPLLNQKQTTNIYYYLIPIIAILAIFAFSILKQKKY